MEFQKIGIWMKQKWNGMTYRKGYFKAILDVLSLIERIRKILIKPSQQSMILEAVLKDILQEHKLDSFMENGGSVQFAYKIEKNKVVHMDVYNDKR